MKVRELSKELGITNKELIGFLRDKGYSISSHMQNMTDEMIEAARVKYGDNAVNVLIDEEEEVEGAEKVSNIEVPVSTKTFKPDDMIPCKSVTPWKLNTVGLDKQTVYHWEYFGDVDYVKYRDLQSFRRTDLITKPKILILDSDLCYQWRNELSDTYKYFLGVNYPEEFFDKSDAEFEKFLKKAPKVIKEVIKVTALNMIKNENYPTLNKLNLIDSILGTCLKDFL